MKNIAIPLLAASSASAQRKDMKDDLATSAPILIADVYNSGTCDDTANSVSTVTTALTALESALATLVTARGGLDTKVTAARTAKQTAIDAVLAADKAVATKLKADDDAQQKLLTLQGTRDAAIYAHAAANTAKLAADTAKTAADAKKTAEDATKVATDLAATKAKEIYDHEVAQGTAYATEKTNKTSAHTTLNNEIAGLTTLYNNAKTASDASATALTTSTTALTAATALEAKLKLQETIANTAKTTATTAKTTGTSPNPTTELATAQTNLDAAGGAGDWIGLSKTTVKAMKTWITDKASTDYVTVHATGGCTGATMSAEAVAANEGACTTVCNGKTYWTVTGNLPVAQVSGGTANTGTHAQATACYGAEWKATGTKCKLVTGTGAITAGSGSGLKCLSRKSSNGARALKAAYDLSTTGVAKYTQMTTKLTAWTGKKNTLIDKENLETVATKIKTGITAKVTAATSDKGTKNTDKINKTNTNTTKQAATTTALTNLNNKKAAVATALTAKTAAENAVTLQTTETASQLAAKNLADADKAAQDLLATAAATAATTAAGAVTTATATLATALTAKTAATTAYNTQKTAADTAAAAVSTPVTNLVTLRATAATKTTELATAIKNLNDQISSIGTKQAEVDAKRKDQQAKIVACESLKYDQYARALVVAEKARKDAIKAIETLLDAKAAAAPARGKAGSRCEKALSNGTFRDKRDPKTVCDTGLCCGAARIPVGKAVMTIETCQSNAKGTKYTYIAPRAPMATTWPTGKAYAFTCIEGAQNLAAAASALAAAVYMLA